MPSKDLLDPMTASEKLLVVSAKHFDDWRATARRLLISGTAPEHLQWVDERQSGERQQSRLFEPEPLPAPLTPESSTSASLSFTVPKDFIELARTVSHHRNPTRWSLLYRMLWRITGGEKHLLQIASDRDVMTARDYEKAVRRDAHKMKAFVRFRKTLDQQGDLFVAWHRPDHYVVPYTAGFFSRRFDVMRWVIMTPDDSVAWDGTKLVYGPGVPRAKSPAVDELEALWKTYYSHIFNPARIKLHAMRAEMPVKHWSTMPETALIDEMLRKAPARVETMIRQTEGFLGANEFVPADARDIKSLRQAAATCKGCDLYKPATQTVFGVGSPDASLMMIGEQPGDQEDRTGEPFVGPSGQLLRRTMAEVGLSDDDVYITNAVKHFKFQETPGRRLHVKPNSREIGACKPWLDAEIQTIHPKMILCLGATPASVIFGPSFRITKSRGEVMETAYAPWTMATFHPSALLRVPDAVKRDEMMSQFRSDLTLAADKLRKG